MGTTCACFAFSAVTSSMSRYFSTACMPGVLVSNSTISAHVCRACSLCAFKVDRNKTTRAQGWNWNLIVDFHHAIFAKFPLLRVEMLVKSVFQGVRLLKLHMNQKHVASFVVMFVSFVASSRHHRCALNKCKRATIFLLKRKQATQSSCPIPALLFPLSHTRTCHLIRLVWSLLGRALICCRSKLTTSARHKR